MVQRFPINEGYQKLELVCLIRKKLERSITADFPNLLSIIILISCNPIYFFVYTINNFELFAYIFFHGLLICYFYLFRVFNPFTPDQMPF